MAEGNLVFITLISPWIVVVEVAWDMTEQQVAYARTFATQKLVVLKSGKEIIRRSGICPRHTIQSSSYLGVTLDGWMFSCREGHNFTTKPARNAPTTIDEVEAWIAGQRALRLSSMNNKGA